MSDMSYAPGFASEQSCKSDYKAAVDGRERPKGNPPPYSMRFTWEERDRLKRESGKQSWAALIRERVFGDHVSKRRKSQTTNADLQAIARLSALLGKSRIPNNLNQMAKAVNTGCLVTDDDTRARLYEACDHVAHMRQLLIAALNVSDFQVKNDD